MSNKLQRSTPIAELLSTRPVARVTSQSRITAAIAEFSAHPQSRTLYVVDDAGRLTGSVALAKLARHVFAHRHEPRIHGRGLLSRVTSKTVTDLARRRPLTARAREPAGEVLDRMVAEGVEEIAVIDDEGRLVGDINLADLLILSQIRQ